MKLVDGAKEFYRWNSVRILAALAVIPPVWAELPTDIKDYVPVEWRPWIMVGIAVCGIIARVRKQPL